MNGELDFDAATRKWRVSGLPGHVSMRFKAVFAQIPTGSAPPFLLKDRQGLATDLLWFMERYPLSVSPAARHFLTEGAERHRNAQDQLHNILDLGQKVAPVTGFRQGTAPRPHQVRAARLWQNTGSLLLLDEVGLGKTVSALAALSEGWGLPAAIIVPPHVSGQWLKRYIERFTHLKAIEITDRNARKLDAADIYLFRYSNIGSWVDHAIELGIQSIIMDEIQELRHGTNTEKGRAVAALRAHVELSLGLSATPIYNYGSEMFNIVQLIRPGFLGSWTEFTINWCINSNGHWLVRDPSALGAYLQSEGVTLRRTEDDPEVGLSIPPLERQVIEVDWHGGDVADKRDLQIRLAQRVLEGGFGDSGMAARELDALLRLETGVAKARSVAAYVSNLIDGGEKVLLGGWHRDVYQIWKEELQDYNPVFYTGTETPKQKDMAIEAMLTGKSGLLIMSNRSGAGVDGLQEVCSQSVIGELDWAPPVHTQFIGRLRSDGQTRSVTAHFTHVNGGSDPVVLSTLGLKGEQSRGLLDPYGASAEIAPPDSRRARQLALHVLGRSSEAEDELMCA